MHLVLALHARALRVHSTCRCTTHCVVQGWKMSDKERLEGCEWCDNRHTYCWCRDTDSDGGRVVASVRNAVGSKCPQLSSQVPDTMQPADIPVPSTACTQVWPATSCYTGLSAHSCAVYTSTTTQPIPVLVGHAANGSLQFAMSVVM